MKRQKIDTISNTDVNIAAPVAPNSLKPAIGILGAVLLALPVTGQAQPDAHGLSTDAASQTRTGIVERFEAVRARLHHSCSGFEFPGLGGSPEKPTNELANWSDW